MYKAFEEAQSRRAHADTGFARLCLSSLSSSCRAAVKPSFSSLSRHLIAKEFRMLRDGVVEAGVEAVEVLTSPAVAGTAIESERNASLGARSLPEVSAWGGGQG